MRSDEELVAAAINDDRTAWDDLVNRYAQLVFANARAVGADRALAHDVGQVVWMRLLTRLETIREPAKIRGWLAIVARNTAREELSRRRPTTSLDEFLEQPDETTPLPEDAAILGDQVSVLKSAMHTLTERCRELLTLLYSAQMSYEEIVVATGTPIGSIGPTRQRCLSQLRRTMSDLTDS